MNGGIDKLTIQVGLIFLVYVATHALMFLLGKVLLPGLEGTIYGFNFLFGVLLATLLKIILTALTKKKIIKKKKKNPSI